jgi:ankyrin repeat protein
MRRQVCILACAAFAAIGCGGIRAATERDDCEPLKAISFAIRLGHIDRVQGLLDLGVNPNVDLQNGWTPLGWAVSWHKEEVALVLIERGADVNRPILGRYAPLRLARLRGMKAAAKLMEERGAVDFQVSALRPVDLADKADILEMASESPFPGTRSQYDPNADH